MVRLTGEETFFCVVDADIASDLLQQSIQNRLARAFLGGLFISFGGLLSQLLSNDPWFSTNAPGLLKILEASERTRKEKKTSSEKSAHAKCISDLTC